MEATRMDALLHTLKSVASRRGLIAGLTGGVLSLPRVGREDADASKGKRKKRRKNKSKRNKAKTRHDATCPGTGESSVRHAAGDRRLAQTFTAIRSGPLVKATLLITDLRNPAGDFVLRLSPVDDSGFPTNELLAESTTALGTSSDEDVELEFAFADPFAVEAGVDYALVLARPVGDAFRWRGDLGNPCSGTVSFSLDQTGPFQSFNDDFDFIFATFVKS
jgi:hypothetical protein